VCRSIMIHLAAAYSIPHFRRLTNMLSAAAEAAAG
jgi:hypothetical protein